MRKFYLINALMLLLTLFSSAGISAAVTTYPFLTRPTSRVMTDGQKQPQATALGADSADIGKLPSTVETAKLTCSALSCRRKAAAATLLHIHWKRVVQGTQMKNSQSIF